MRNRLQFCCVILGVAFAASALVAQVRKDTVEGIRNFTVVDPTIACAGATEASAMAPLKARGYAAVINLRQASEAGAAIEESKAAATAVGLTFIHLPFNTANPDPGLVEAFLKAVGDPKHQPVFINCASANRASALLLIKRLLVDKWEEARALEEAKAIGLTNEALQKFALDYVATHRAPLALPE